MNNFHNIYIYIKATYFWRNILLPQGIKKLDILSTQSLQEKLFVCHLNHVGTIIIFLSRPSHQGIPFDFSLVILVAEDLLPWFLPKKTSHDPI